MVEPVAWKGRTCVLISFRRISDHYLRHLFLGDAFKLAY
jgi:hypothetical protein